MWRNSTFAGNQDSDQSISEEEDLASDWPENCIALGGTAENKGGIRIQSQLEVLRDTRELDHGTETAILFNKRQIGFSSEDEVEIPVFPDAADLISSPRIASTCNSEEEIISDNEEVGLHGPGSEKQDGACTWSEANKEAEALVHLIENARSSSLHAVSSNVKKPSKGGQGKARSKFLFRFLSREEDNPWPVIGKAEVNTSPKLLPAPQELDAVDNRAMENSMAESASGYDYTEYSMAEHLDSYQEKTGLSWGNSKMYTIMKGKRGQLVDERNIPPLGGRDMDNDDPPEALDSGSSSADEVFHEAKVQNLGRIIPEYEQKTITDKFQEAFGAASVNEEGTHLGLHSIGIFGKLQRVMQSDKKRDMDFLKKLEMGDSSKDEGSCIDAEILSRFLEAKLTVCCCSLSRDNESFKWAEGKENQRRTLTIIFSSRVCEDVELEVGNIIRIHSPWKEVQVGATDEVIILSAYFSQISS